jgi:hypothetical protein
MPAEEKRPRFGLRMLAEVTRTNRHWVGGISSKIVLRAVVFMLWSSAVVNVPAGWPLVSSSCLKWARSDDENCGVRGLGG